MKNEAETQLVSAMMMLRANDKVEIQVSMLPPDSTSMLSV